MEEKQVFYGSCHCGKVQFELNGTPEWLVSCNCSICSRLGSLWTHADSASVKLSCNAGDTNAYIWGDKTLALHSCKVCGCTTHWQSLDAKITRVGLNFRMCKQDEIAAFRIRKLDGADSCEFLD